MIYLFIGALLVITGKAQDLTPCITEENCVNASAPICSNVGFGSFCVPCTTTTDCTGNVDAYGPDFECNVLSPGLGACLPAGFSLNFTNPSSNFTIPTINITNPSFNISIPSFNFTIPSQCVNDSDCAADETCQTNPLFGINYCSNETSPFCSSSADCADLYAGSPITASCQNFSTFLEVNGTNTTIPVTVPYCIPNDQCYNNTDCPGGLCLTSPELGFKYCQIDFNVTCSDAADCPGDQGCYVPEGACYTPCNNDTDCGLFFVCLSPEPGINACLPPGFNFNVTINLNITNDTDTDTDLSALCTACEGEEDCDDYTEDGGVCTEIDLGITTLSCCVPPGTKLCSGSDDCLAGQECIIEVAGGGSCETVYVTGCSTDPDDCDEGLTCFDASSYNGIDNFCYLGCTQATEDTDCGDGYICGSELYEDTIDLPKCVYDATTLGTDSPTMEPTPSPTTAAPTEDSDDETNPSYGQQLAIFGGMIIMFAHAVFM